MSASCATVPANSPNARKSLFAHRGVNTVTPCTTTPTSSNSYPLLARPGGTSVLPRPGGQVRFVKEVNGAAFSAATIGRNDRYNS